MSSILSDEIRTCRKAKTCDQCLKLINVGDRYRRQVHTFDGFCAYSAHEDCDRASSELHELAGLRSDESYTLHEYGSDDKEFLIEKYPEVAARLRCV